jgi:hypothetical protein
MTELGFWETTIGKRPVSFAIDIDIALALGFKVNGGKGKKYFPSGWHDLTIYLGPLSLTFTVYGRGA